MSALHILVFAFRDLTTAKNKGFTATTESCRGLDIHEPTLASITFPALSWRAGSSIHRVECRKVPIHQILINETRTRSKYGLFSVQSLFYIQQK
jgi:hypothetical protein